MCANLALASSAAFCASRGRRKQLGTAQGEGAPEQNRGQRVWGDTAGTQVSQDMRQEPTPLFERGGRDSTWGLSSGSREAGHA